MSKPSSRFSNNEILHEISSRLAEVADQLFDYLNIYMYRQKDHFRGPCPIHGGRRHNFRFWQEGKVVKGGWMCMSKKCHKYFPRSAVGFVRGVLSNQINGWVLEDGYDKQVSTPTTVKFCLEFLNIELKDIKFDADRADRMKFVNFVDYMSSGPPIFKTLCSRKKLRSFIQIPPDYYINRGYLIKTLDEYDVGLCQNPRSDLCGRVVVPFYDSSCQKVIGCLGRTPHDDTPGSTWTVSEAFKSHYHLYNFWKAREIIFSSKCVVIVEGVGDVWRAREGGIDNVVAIMGGSLTDAQKGVLEECPISNFIIITDSDQAGDAAAHGIMDDLERYGDCIRIRLRAKDLGETPLEEVRDVIKPQVESYMKRG